MGKDSLLEPTSRNTERADVLVVDDSSDVLAAVSELLTDFGLDVQVAYNGELALSMIHTTQPRCVIFDLDMPVMNGHEFAQVLRTHFSSHLLLIGMSGHSIDHPAVVAMGPLVDYWFAKPLDWKVLETVLSKLKHSTGAV